MTKSDGGGGGGEVINLCLIFVTFYINLFKLFNVNCVVAST